jgi:hypothetical protein
MNNARIRVVLGVLCGLLAAGAVVQAQEMRQDATALHNYGKRKVVRAHRAVMHSAAHVHHYVHRKNVKARHWLNTH